MGGMFMRGVVWGGILAGMGLTYMWARDEKRRQKLMTKGAQIGDFMRSMGQEMMEEGQETWREMKLEKEIPSMRREIMSKLKELESEVAKMGDRVME